MFVIAVSSVMYLILYKFVLVPPASILVKSPLYFKYPPPGHSDSIWAYQCIKPLTFPHSYEYTVELVVPEMPQNMDMGIFMVKLILLKGDTRPRRVHDIPRLEYLQFDERPVMLRWKNSTLMYIRSLIFAIPRIFLDLIGLNWFDEKQVLKVKVMENEPFPHGRDEQCIIVMVNNPKLNVYEAKITAVPQLFGWRYYGYYWFYTSMFVGISTLTTMIMSMIVGVVLFVWIRALLRKRMAIQSKAAVDKLNYQFIEQDSEVDERNWRGEMERKDALALFDDLSSGSTLEGQEMSLDDSSSGSETQLDTGDVCLEEEDSETEVTIRSRKKQAEVVSMKWKTLEHNGVYIPPYKPHGVKMKYNGKEIDLTEEEEELATLFAKALIEKQVTSPRIEKNMFNSFVDVLYRGSDEKYHKIQSFDKCDFTPIINYLNELYEKKAKRSKAERDKEKEEKRVIREKYGYALVDGQRKPLNNYKIKKPSIYIGPKGDHSSGKIRFRIKPENITLNIGEDAKIPEAPDGHKWGKIVHEHGASWIASWRDHLSGETTYIKFEESPL